MSADSGPGNREVAYRVFAAEFEDSTVSYSESDEERAPNYVVTPTGGRVNRVFLVGVLTEIERVGGEQLRARVVDPTGAFVAYAGQYQPDELAFLDRVDPPAFLAITGKARTFSPEDSDRVYTSVRPESISEVDTETRDRWVVSTAEQTLDRVSTMASALRSGLRGEELRDRLVEAGVDPGLASGTALAVERYGTTSAYLQALRATALDAARVVAGERDEVDRLDLAPDEGGTESAVLAGLAGLDLGTATGSGTGGEPTVVADASAGSSEPAASSAPEGTDAGADVVETADTGGTETSTDAGAAIESEPEPEPEPETGAETRTEPESEPTEAADPEPESERRTTTATGSGTGSDGADAGTVETSASGEPEAVGSDEPDDPGESGEPERIEDASTDDEEFEDFEPGEFELPDEEREEIEEEYGTDFETAGEVEPAGEAGIETPEPKPEAEPEPDESPTDDEEPTSATDADPEPASGSSATSTGTAGASEQAPTGADAEREPEPETEAADEDADGGDVDVDEATVEVIAELDDGDGADRDAVISTVAERHGVDPEAVDEAIENAMMSGRAYEPSDGSLKAI